MGSKIWLRVCITQETHELLFGSIKDKFIRDNPTREVTKINGNELIFSSCKFVLRHD